MKRILTIVFLLSTTCVFAQRTGHVGVSTGIVNYVGDLGHEKYFPYSSASVGTAITIRDFINNPERTRTKFAILDMQIRFSWHRLQYDEVNPIGDKEGIELRNYRRGLGFRNDLFGTEIDFTYNIFPNLYSPLNKQKISIYFLGGVGMFYGTPKADLFRGDDGIENRYYYWKDGTIRDQAENNRGLGNVIQKDGEYETDLSKWATEGQGYDSEIHSKKEYSKWNVGFPLGIGFRYMISPLVTLSTEVNYYYFLTDYLDDVSERYATHEELRASFPNDKDFELAKYISDPSGHGTNGVVSTASKRGNPNHKDSFTYVSLEASYKFTWKKKGIYGQ